MAIVEGDEGVGCKSEITPPTLVHVQAWQNHLSDTQCGGRYIIDEIWEVMGNYDRSIRRRLSNYPCYSR